MKTPFSKSTDIHLKVSPQHVEFLNSLPDFSSLSTVQLWAALPTKYRKHILPTPIQGCDRQTRATIIGMLAHPVQIETHIGVMFLERL